jgi:hypothetical protein
VLALVAVAELAALLTLSAPANPDKPGVAGGIRTAAAQLRGEGPPIDLVQDYVGARKLVLGGDPYLRLTQAFASVGITWRADHRSTHPPTAFVLVLPVAWLPWKAAAAAWAVLMLMAIAGAWWALGLSPELAAALAPLTLLWPPAAWSLGQLTPLWLLGLALAWRFRAHPAAAGAAIALASLTKLLPALSLLPFLVSTGRRVLSGFVAGWAVVLAFLLLLRSSALDRYLDVARSAARVQAGRGENSALLWASGHNFGVTGVAAAILLVAAVLVVSFRRLWGAGRIDRWSWDAWTWAGVALLPIAWIYSLLPLLPVLVGSVRRGGFIVRALALAGFVIPLVVDPFGLPGGLRLAVATACLGVALLALGATPSLKWRLSARGLPHRLG